MFYGTKEVKSLYFVTCGNLVDIRLKLNLHELFILHPGYHMNVLPSRHLLAQSNNGNRRASVNLAKFNNSDVVLVSVC